MKWIIASILLVAAQALSATGQSTNPPPAKAAVVDLATLQAQYTNNMASVHAWYGKAVAFLVTAYTEELQALRGKAQQAGELDAVKGILAELARVNAEQSLPVPSAVGASMQGLAAGYQQRLGQLGGQREQSLRAFAVSYGSSLEVLQKKLTQAGKLDEATAVQAERKALAAALPVKAAEPVVVAPNPVASPGGRPQVINVDLKRPWPVVLRVERGQTLHIKASGRWKVHEKGFWKGPGDDEYYLQGRLGEGKPFKVGTDFTLPIIEDGVLSLGMMEGGDYSNNAGNIEVTIEVTRAGTAVVATLDAGRMQYAALGETAVQVSGKPNVTGSMDLNAGGSHFAGQPSGVKRLGQSGNGQFNQNTEFGSIRYYLRGGFVGRVVWNFGWREPEGALVQQALARNAAPNITWVAQPGGKWTRSDKATAVLRRQPDMGNWVLELRSPNYTGE